MVEQNEIDFIKEYILKTGEQLDMTENLMAKTRFIDLPIVKRTERTFRVVGLLTIAANDNNTPVQPDEILKKAKITVSKKIRLNDHDPNTIKWFEEGWILKEIRFKKDGKTPDSQNYRMGFRLFQYEQDRLKAQEEKLEQDLQNWKKKFQSLNQRQVHFHTGERRRGLNLLIEISNDICQLKGFQIKNSCYFPEKWQVSKRFRFLEFLLAFVDITLRKAEFDWKEIGAAYYKEIGGSKEFDHNKDEFIDQLENLAQCPATILGLTSLGKITPLYFSGQLKGNFSSYQFGVVHALTDLSISQDHYSTNAKSIWLVENRAVLTRIASEKDFLKDTDSLMLCVDGHLRSSHKKCLMQLLRNSNLLQAIIWTDYDPDGKQIAKEIYETLLNSGCQLQMKWVTAEHKILGYWHEYENYMNAFLKTRRMEQEEVLGCVEDWKKWVLH